MASWVPTTNTLATARTGCGRVTLQNGDVLAIAGWTGTPPSVTILSSCELLDHTTQTWSPVGSLSVARVAPHVVLLNDGTVLVTGGQTSTGGTATNVTEIYDPIAQTWSTVGPMGTGRYFAGVFLLGNGKVLIAGGSTALGADTASCEIYDPVAQTWSSTGSLPAATHQPIFGMMGDGRPILVATFYSGTPVSHTYTFSSGSWTTQVDPPVAMQNDDNNGAIILQNGNLLVLCPLKTDATNNFPWPHVYQYNKGTDTWSTGSGPATPHNSTPYLLSNGTVLLPGGMLEVAPNVNTDLVDIYDPNTDIWTSAPSLPASGIISANCSEFKGPLLSGTKPVWFGIQHDGGAFSDNAAYVFESVTHVVTISESVSMADSIGKKPTIPVADTQASSDSSNRHPIKGLADLIIMSEIVAVSQIIGPIDEIILGEWVTINVTHADGWTNADE